MPVPAYKPEYVAMARKACEAGFTDRELGELFGVTTRTIHRWKLHAPEFAAALKLGKDIPDERVERSLYSRATGYSYDSVKVFMPASAAEPVYAPIVEHVPPDTTACIFWLKNRRPDLWRDVNKIEHSGAVEISDGRERLAHLIARQTAGDAAESDPPTIN